MPHILAARVRARAVCDAARLIQYRAWQAAQIRNRALAQAIELFSILLRRNARMALSRVVFPHNPEKSAILCLSQGFTQTNILIGAGELIRHRFEVECNAVVCRRLREPQLRGSGSQYEPNMVNCGS